jgi:RHS repeat-associated protein
MRAWNADTGQTVWAADCEAFGRAWTYVPNSSAPPDFEINLRLPGQYFDAETGLYYNGHWYYSPELGQYLTVDPVDDQSGMSPYVYTAANPLRFIDPRGEFRYDPKNLAKEGITEGDWRKWMDAIMVATVAFEEKCKCRQMWTDKFGSDPRELLVNGFGPSLLFAPERTSTWGTTNEVRPWTSPTCAYNRDGNWPTWRFMNSCTLKQASGGT